MPDTTHQPIVAIDGPAGSGKSTVAKLVAERAGLQFISSGAMYRAVALFAMREGISATERSRLVQLADGLQFQFTTDMTGMVHTLVNGEDVTEQLNKPEVGQMASAIATIPELRARLVETQQVFGRTGGVVMEGRDIQTVVFPDAEIKVFLTASAEERARRRWEELSARGESISYPEVMEEVRARDTQDESREASPLKAAPDAICIDTDGLTITQVVERILRLIEIWRENPELRGESLVRAANLTEGTC